MEKSSVRAEKFDNRDKKRNLQDLTSNMQKIGQAKKAVGRMAKKEATMVFAENNKQALLQFAYKRMGLRTTNHVCRKNGDDVSISDPIDVTDFSFAIQEDALTGKFWLFMKVDGTAELQSL